MAANRSVVLAGRAMERVVAVARDCGYLDGIPIFSPRMRLPTFRATNWSCWQPEARARAAPRSPAFRRAATLPFHSVQATSDFFLANHSRQRKGGRPHDQQSRKIRRRSRYRSYRARPRLGASAPRRSRAALRLDPTTNRDSCAWRGRSSRRTCGFCQIAGRTPHVITARNGDVVLLAPGPPGIVGRGQSGRLCKDGNCLIPIGDEALKTRQRLAVSGIVTIALAVTAKGDLAGVPDVVTAGIPARARDATAIDAIIDDALFQTFDQCPGKNGATRTSSPPRSKKRCATLLRRHGASGPRSTFWSSRCDRVREQCR